LIHDFDRKLAFSMGEREDVDVDIIRQAIAGCVTVRKTDPEIDRLGVDYMAVLRGGTVIGIDAKAREKGASRFWKHGEPELALETWSVVGAGRWKGKCGWTLSESSRADYILFTFDAEDSDRFYLLPFHQLRTAFRRHYPTWAKRYQKKRQYSNGWESEAIFVPVSVVLDAVTAEMSITKGTKHDHYQTA
jgi:hypothetical protein